MKGFLMGRRNKEVSPIWNKENNCTVKNLKSKSDLDSDSSE
jgi:hypothetical protein